MEKGLLLDGVDVHGTGIAVDQGIVLPVPIFSDTAIASLPTGGLAVPGAEFTAYTLIGKGRKIRREFWSEKSLFDLLGV